MFGAGQDPEQIPPLVLAYIGDAVYELYVRSALVARGITKVNLLHQEAVSLVRASSQSRFLKQIEEQLTEAEIRVMKRGRNANSGSPPKGAEVTEYRRSTGLESLIGYLYLKGDDERLEEILSRLPWPGEDKQ
ncbi:MAG: Mini-ribonuclease 3 [Firmicutes bacterium]|nr:Mini-ribonuclease 3 [Bacillota bacterium]